MRLCPYCHNPLSDAEVDQLKAENAKLRELVRDMFYAVHPADREKFLTNVAELGVDDGVLRTE